MKWFWVPMFVVLAMLPSAARASSPSARAVLPDDVLALADGDKVPPLPPEYLTHEEGGFRFAYHPSARERVRTIIAAADATRRELTAQLGVEVLGRFDVRVAVGPNDYDRILPAGAPVGAVTLALAERRILFLAVGQRSSAELLRSFRHGMAHLAIVDAADGRSVPRWLHEGYAIHFAEQAVWERGRVLWWAAVRQRLIRVADLDSRLGGAVAPSSVAAAQAAAFARYLSAPEQGARFGALFAELREGRRFGVALQASYHADLDALEQRWRADLAGSGGFVPVLLGSTALWMLVALVVTYRRRRRKPLDEVESEPLAEPLAEPPDSPIILSDTRSAEPKRKRPKRKAAKRKRRHGARDGVVHLAIELEVPKVSHDGQWHTLH